jgi:hypothetical protein
LGFGAGQNKHSRHRGVGHSSRANHGNFSQVPKTACFHAQQAVEKCLKGLLALHGQAFPATHNLEELQRLGEGSVPG